MHNWRHVTGLGWGGDVNVHVNSRHMHNWRHVTGLGWGGDVNVHVNLRHMHNWRHVTGLGWGGHINVHVNLRLMHNWRHVTGLGWGGDVNVHVNLRHMHNWRHVTGLGWGGDVNVHVNLRHMHNWRHVQGWVEKGVLLNDWWSDVAESVQQKKKQWFFSDVLKIDENSKRNALLVVGPNVTTTWRFYHVFTKPYKYHDLVNQASWKIHELPRVANRAVALF